MIEVKDENTPVIQRHYPMSPVVQNMVFVELDRLLQLELTPVSCYHTQQEEVVCGCQEGQRENREGGTVN
ncbi:unnamed protein product, partial [Ceratitis capitata]